MSLGHTQRNRWLACEAGQVFLTSELVEWLEKATGAAYELDESVIRAWLTALRTEVVSRAEEDESFRKELEKGIADLTLTNALSIQGLEPLEVYSQVSAQTGVPHGSVKFLLAAVSNKLREISEKKAFEPLGWIRTRMDGEGRELFDIALWRDYLAPRADQSDEGP